MKNSSQNLEQPHLIGLIDACRGQTHRQTDLLVSCGPDLQNQTDLNMCVFSYVGVWLLPSRVKALRVVQSSFVSSTPSITGLRPCLVYRKSFALPESRARGSPLIQKTCSMCTFTLCHLGTTLLSNVLLYHAELHRKGIREPLHYIHFGREENTYF